jgi:hypothetical protein
MSVSKMTDIGVDGIGSISDSVRDISLHYRVQTDSRNYPCSWPISAGALFPREWHRNVTVCLRLTPRSSMCGAVLPCPHATQVVVRISTVTN